MVIGSVAMEPIVATVDLREGLKGKVGYEACSITTARCLKLDVEREFTSYTRKWIRHVVRVY
jgi:hypothetical protein